MHGTTSQKTARNRHYENLKYQLYDFVAKLLALLIGKVFLEDCYTDYFEV